jgi:ABC-2 type transport system ATP-binding protein
MSAVEVRGVRKTFRRNGGWRGLARKSASVTALEHIDLDVAAGEIFGLLGPNGAGKTTLIKILCGLILPDDGQVTISGYDMLRAGPAARRALGVVYGDERSFHWRLSVRENLRFFATLYGLDRVDADRRIDELLDLVDLAYAADRRMLSFSSGMKQRASVARGLLHDPQVILMDEPTRMLDPIGTHELHALIRNRIAAAGRTVLVATNLMAEAETLCDRLLLIDRGLEVMTGTVEEFKAAFSPEISYRFVVEGHVEMCLERVRRVPGVAETRVEEEAAGVAEIVVVLDETGRALPVVFRLLVEYDLQILRCVKEEASLEQVFRSVVGRRPEAAIA